MTTQIGPWNLNAIARRIRLADTARRPRGAALRVELLEGRALLSGAGSLDPNFGTGGHVTTSFTTGWDGARGSFLQPDGRIVTLGTSSSPNWLWDVARYNPDGSLDTSFGSGGTASTPVHGDFWSGALEPDSAQPNAPKILEAGSVSVTSGGTTNSDFQLVRFNNDGSLDTSFGGTGKVTAGSGTAGDELAAVAVEPDGKLVAGGDGFSAPGGYDAAVLLRYNPDGTLDPTYGTGGKVLTRYRTTAPQDPNYVEDIAIQADGKVVTVGESVVSYSDSWVTVARYNTDGSLDTSFGTAGTGLVVINTSGIARSVAIQPDGKIIVAGGWTVGSSTGQFAVARLNPDGTLDSTFGTGGVTAAGTGQAHGVAVQLSGGTVTGIVAAGAGTSGSGLVTRFDASGQLDNTFGSGGVVTESTYSPQKVAIQPDGNILVDGNTPGSSGRDFIVTRYLGAATATPALFVTAQPPASVTAGSPFSVTVQATDSSGKPLSSYSGSVAIALANNPSGAALGGTLTVTATNGMATFADLSLTKAATGYTLAVTASGLDGATTTALAVTPAAATQLVIIQQPPASVTANTAFGLVAAVEDQFGNIVTSATNAVTVSLGTNPGGSTLGGATTVNAVGGYVTFSSLKLNRRGKGYRLRLSAAGLSDATTSSFNAR